MASLDWTALATALTDLKTAVADIVVLKAKPVPTPEGYDALVADVAQIKTDLAALQAVVAQYTQPPPEQPPAEQPPQ